MAITLKDIAEYTGVGTSTVSTVLNGKGVESRISEEMIERIKAAAEKLNYRPNMLARNLKKGKTETIGFVVPDLSNALFNKLATHIETEALKYGYQVFVVGSDENDERCDKVIDSFLNFRVDGLILAATQGIEEKIQQLSNQKIPFVLVDRYFPKVSTNYVAMNNWQASYDATEYLIKKGKRRIASFSYITDFHHMSERLNGYRAALKTYGIRYDKRLVPSLPFLNIHEDEIKRSINQLKEEYDIDAIFFQTNRTALPGIKALYEFNYKIPDEVSVICFDDNEFFKLLSPKITSLVQPIEEMAIECVRILIDEINNKRDNRMKNKTIFSAKLIERESC